MPPSLDRGPDRARPWPGPREPLAHARPRPLQPDLRVHRRPQDVAQNKVSSSISSS